MTCDDWNQFRQNSLSIPLDGVEISAVTISSGFRASQFSELQNSSVSCATKTAAASIANGLMKDTAFSVICDGSQWRYASCDSNPFKVLCVDCTPDANGCYGFPGTVVAPCREGNLQEVYYSVVEMGLEQTIQYPTITNVAVTATEDTAFISVNATLEGMVYCASYRAGSKSFVDVGPIRNDGADGTLVSSSANGNTSTTAVLTITGLAPDTGYDVFCFSEDFKGNVMPIDAALLTRRVFKTNCCRRVVISRNFSSIIEYSASAPAESVFQFTLNAQPETPVSLTVGVVARTCSDGDSIGTGTANAFPSYFVMTNETQSTTGSFVVRGERGCYMLTVSASDESYASASDVLTILPDGADLPAPTLSTAIFSNDGRKIIVSLDKESDFAASVITNYGTSFLCSLLVEYPGIATSKCTWQSSTTLVVTLSYSGNSYVYPGDSLSLLSGKVRAGCPQGRNCQYFPYNSPSSVRIKKPVSSIYPVAALSTNAQVISPCNSLVLDPTQSTNKGGSRRPWESIAWSVSGDGINISHVATLLKAYTNDTDQRINIPNEFLKKGFATIRLSVKNFLGRSAVGSIVIEVVDEEVPKTNIFGPGVRTMYVWQKLELFTNAGFISCSGNVSASNSSQLLYNWAVYKGVTFVPSKQSLSNDPRAFKLDPYALDLYASYTVVVKVRTADADAAIATTYKVAVQTVRSYVEAVIGGGELFAVSSTDPVRLDGSESMDKDFPSSPHTTFKWTCVETSPSYGAPCNIVLTSESVQSFNASQLVSDIFATYDHIFKFALRVTAYDGLFAETEADLVVMAGVIPDVSFTAIADKYDAASDIVIGAVIDSSTSLLAKWNGTGLHLNDIATTTVMKQVAGGSSVTFQLGIRANSLFPGKAYTFQLLVSGGDGEFRVMAQQTIIINEPPSNGLVDITPQSGYALNTSFFISAAAWDDDPDDFPLKYVIVSYNEDASKVKMLKASTEVPYVTTVLSQGLDSMAYHVTCLVIVVDIYDSEGRADATVQVQPLPADMINDAASSQLTAAFEEYNADSISAIANSATESANSANCTLAPVCDLLNRLPCKSTAHTCGECMSDDYVGVEGDSNEFCAQTTNGRRRLATLSIGDQCSPGDFCVGGSCLNGICVNKLKECSTNCSYNGKCRFVDNKGDELAEDIQCTTSDSFCSAQCYCNTGFYGKDCALSQSEYENDVNLREMLCAALHDAMSLQDLSSDIVLGRARLVYDIILDPSLISETALSSCMDVVITTVFESNSFLHSPSVSNAVLQALSKLISFAKMLTVEELDNLSDAISLLVSIRQGLLPAGSDAVFSISTNARYVSTKRFGVDLSDDSLMSPSTAYEGAVGDDQTFVSFSSNEYEDVATYGISLIMSNSYLLFMGSDNATGNAAQVEFTDYTGNSELSQTVTVVIPNYRALEYVEEVVQSGFVECPISESGQTYNVSIECQGYAALEASSHIITCPGIMYSNVSYSCPSYEIAPQCLSFDGSSFAVDPACSVLDYTSTSVTCSCMVGSGGARFRERRRSLQKDDSMASMNVLSVVKENTKTFTYLYDNQPLSAGPGVSQQDPTTMSEYIMVTFTLAFCGACIGLAAVILNVREVGQLSDDMPVTDFFAAVLPVELSDKKWTTRLSDRLCQSGPLYGLFFHGKNSHLQLTKLANLFVSICFADIVWAIFTLTDENENCITNSSRSSCLASRNGPLSFASGKSLCEWDESSATCSFRDAEPDYVPVVMLTMLVLITAIPLNAMSDLCITKICSYNSWKSHSGRGVSKVARVYMTADDDAEPGVSKLGSDVETISAWESTKSKMSVASRLHLTTTRLDKVSAAEEVLAMDIRKKKTLAAVSLTSRRSLPLGGTALDGSSTIAVKAVSWARTEAHVIAADVDNVVQDTYKQIVMLQHFLVHSCAGWKRPLAKLHLTSSGMFADRRHQSDVAYWSACLCLIGYLFVAAFVVYSNGPRLTPASARLWFAAACLSLLKKTIVIDCLYVFLVDVVIAAVVRKDIIRLHHRLRDHGDEIMNRGFTKMALAHRRIQSLNPVCRLSRMQQRLPIARLLIQLHDLDIPASYAKEPPYSSFICMAVAGLFALLAMLPVSWHKVIIEATLTTVTSTSLVVLYNLGQISIAIPIAVAVAIALIVVPAVYFDWMIDDSQCTRRSRRKRYKYVVSSSGDAKVGVVTAPPCAPPAHADLPLHSPHPPPAKMEPSPLEVKRTTSSRLIVSRGQSIALTDLEEPPRCILEPREWSPAPSHPSTPPFATPPVEKPPSTTIPVEPPPMTPHQEQSPPAEAERSLQSDIDEAANLPLPHCLPLPHRQVEIESPICVQTTLGDAVAKVESADEVPSLVNEEKPVPKGEINKEAVRNILFERMDSEGHNRQVLTPLAPMEERGYRKDQETRYKKKKKRAKLRDVAVAGDSMKHVVLQHQTSWSIINAVADNSDGAESPTDASVTSDVVADGGRKGSKHRRVTDPDAKYSPGILDDRAVSLEAPNLLDDDHCPTANVLPGADFSVSYDEIDQSLPDITWEPK